MEKQEQILQAVYGAIDQLNETLSADQQIVKDPETVLLGANGSIDSLGLTMFIVAVEQKVEENLGSVVTLVDASTMNPESSPFQTVLNLVKHIEDQLS